MAAWLAVLLAFAPVPGAAADTPSGFLEVYSEGYSRYEIERGDDGDQQVVAFFTGGVEFSYLGYRMSADELRYNQATGRATISGAVELWLTDDAGEVETQLSCAEIIIDGENGHGEVPGVLRGKLNYGETELGAGSAEFWFPAGQAVREASELSLLLKDGVSLATADGLSFSTALAQYDGPTGRLSAPGQVSLTGSELSESEPPGEPSVWLSVTGSSLTAEIDPETGMSWAELASVNAEFSGGWLSAGTIRLEPEGAPADGGVYGAAAWHVSMHNGPVSGMLMQEDGNLEVSAEELGGVLDSGGIREISLTGQAQVRREDFEFSSSEIQVTRRAEGVYSFSAPELTEARFDFAQLSGSEPLSIETIQGWLD